MRFVVGLDLGVGDRNVLDEAGLPLLQLELALHVLAEALVVEARAADEPEVRLVVAGTVHTALGAEVVDGGTHLTVADGNTGGGLIEDRVTHDLVDHEALQVLADLALGHGVEERIATDLLKVGVV